MIERVFVLAILFQISVEAAAFSAPSPALFFETGFIIPYACSGAVVENADWPSRYMFLTAAHCVRSNATIRARRGNSVALLEDLNPVITRARLRKDEVNRTSDLALFPLEDSPPGDRVLRVAERQPAVGEKIHVYGYPVVAQVYRPALDLECRAAGHILLRLDTGPVSVYRAAICDARYWVGGASGGPVVDDRGFVVGALSGVWASIVFPDRPDLRGKMIMVYTPVDRETLGSDPEVRAGRRMLPVKQGRIHFERVMTVEPAGKETLTSKALTPFGFGFEPRTIKFYRGSIDFEDDAMVGSNVVSID